MHRWTPWWLAIGVIVAVAGTACTSASGSGKSTVLASAEPAGSGAAGSAVSSAAIGATVFTCPSAAEINSLTAMGFTAAVGNGTDHCEYVVTTGSTQAVRVSINHPPASATSAGQTLPEFRAAIVAAGNVVLTTAPQYSTDSFIARFGTLSCSVFALARDGQVMQVQASHQTPVPLDDCSLAQSVTAVAGTATRAAAPTSAPGSGAGSGTVSGSGPVSSGQVGVSSGPATSSTPVLPTPTPTPAPVPTPTTPRRPSTPSSTSEVLIFSTGPAASLTLPTPRTTRSR